MAFQDELRKLREDRNLTQEQARDRLFDAPARTYACWESGERTPPEWLQQLILAWLKRAPKGAGPKKKGRKPKGQEH